MSTEFQDKAWQVLPKEFKEEVKKEYYDCKHCNADACAIELETVFGKHNLASDAEGEEMLIAPRRDIIELYQEVQKTISQCKGTVLAIQAIGIKNVLWSFFGSKCLPDEVGNEDNFATKEPKPAEPKFTKGDMVHCKSFGYEGDYKVLEYTGGPRNCYDCIDKYGAYYRFYESDLEPYTEPKEKNHIAQDLEMVDNIIKDGFSKERRLNIAAQLTCAMLPKYQDDGNGHGLSVLNGKDMIKCAYRLADALITESERGGQE